MVTSDDNSVTLGSRPTFLIAPVTISISALAIHMSLILSVTSAMNVRLVVSVRSGLSPFHDVLTATNALGASLVWLASV